MNCQTSYQDLSVTYCYTVRTAVCGAAFIDTACYEFYIARLLYRSRLYGVRLHAYCLLADEILLLASSGNDRSMQALLDSVDKSYCDYFNLRFRRYLKRLSPGYHALAILDDASMLECQKYIETEPCRQLQVRHPGEYHWSSYNRHAFGGAVAGLVRHRALRRFLHQAGNDNAAYRAYLASNFSPARQRYLARQIRQGEFLVSDLRRQKRQSLTD